MSDAARVGRGMNIRLSLKRPQAPN